MPLLYSFGLFSWGVLKRCPLWLPFLLLCLWPAGDRLLQEWVRASLSVTPLPPATWPVLAGMGLGWAAILTFHDLRKQLVACQAISRQQAAAARLGLLRADAIERLLNAQVTTDADLSKWKFRQEYWRARVLQELQTHFTPAEYQAFDELAPPPARTFPHAYNDEHNRHLIYLAERLRRLQRIIEQTTSPISAARP